MGIHGTSTPGPGPRFKLTTERKDRIVSAIRASNYAYVAAGWAGIGRSTYYDYIARGQELLGQAIDDELVTPELVEEAQAVWQLAADEAEANGAPPQIPKNPIGEVLRSHGWPEIDVLLVELVDEVERAEAEAEVRILLAWNKAATVGGDWRAGAALLQRRHPERWADHTKTEITGAGGGPIEVSGPAGEIARAIAEDPDARKSALDLLGRVAPKAPPTVASAQRDADTDTGENGGGPDDDTAPGPAEIDLS